MAYNVGRQDTVRRGIPRMLYEKEPPRSRKLRGGSHYQTFLLPVMMIRERIVRKIMIIS